jgi:predicted enzyme related to lactoylglutathione lyase
MELGTSDAAAAKKFYSELFGWHAVDAPAGPNMIYTLLQIEGKNVGALYELNEAQKGQGTPPNWLSYISVSSADETTAKAQQLGGNVMMGPFDVFDLGRMSVLQDPTGAVFAVWQPRSSIGAKLRDELNTFCWNELATKDTAKALEFYKSLFGWGAKTGDPAYTELQVGDRPMGGMLKIMPEWGDVPPYWMGYIAVSDCDGIAEKARSLAAHLLVPPTDIPNVGRFATIKDPQGAVFAVIKLTHAA